MIARDGKRGFALGVVLLATALLAGCITLKSGGAKSGRLIGSWVDDFYGFKDPKYIAAMDQFNLFEVFTEWNWTEPENDHDPLTMFGFHPGATMAIDAVGLRYVGPDLSGCTHP